MVKMTGRAASSCCDRRFPQEAEFAFQLRLWLAEGVAAFQDTIAAIATPPGEGAVALVRVSGRDAVSVAARVIHPARGGSLTVLTPRMQCRATVADLDNGLVTVFRAPASYTGEDVVEFSGHGGPLLARRVLEAIVGAGARVAEPGEFTQRAFLHGKMDLTQAEAVMDLIRAQSDLALRAAREQLGGVLGRRIEVLRDDLLEVVAHVEAYIDFPDEDISPDSGALMLARLDAVRARVSDLLDTARPGRMLREGVRTVIFGAPNAGKSSLLNALAGHDRAIVSHLPGTTRDTIEEFLSVRGLPLRLIDTAGLRDAPDEIERQGIERTHRALEEADLALEVVDASQSPPSGASAPARSGLLVLNKLDLGEHAGWQGVVASRVSCLSGAGIAALADAIYDRVTGGDVRWSSGALAAVNTRHRDCLGRAAAGLDDARATLVAGASPEFVAVDLRVALNAIGEVIGGTDVESVLGRIFATFCLGK